MISWVRANKIYKQFHKPFAQASEKHTPSAGSAEIFTKSNQKITNKFRRKTKMAFTNRQVTNPGRVKLIPVAGEANTYDMTRNEGPVTKEGTSLDSYTLKNEIEAIIDEKLEDFTTQDLETLVKQMLSKDIYRTIYTAPNSSGSDIVHNSGNTNLNGVWSLPASVMDGYNPNKKTRITVSGQLSGTLSESSGAVYFPNITYNEEIFDINVGVSSRTEGNNGKVYFILTFDTNTSGITHTYSYGKMGSTSGSLYMSGGLRIVKVEQTLL